MSSNDSNNIANFHTEAIFVLEKVSYQVYVKPNASKTKENVKLKCIMRIYHFVTSFPTHAFTFHFIGLIFVKIIKCRASVFDFL